MSLKKISKTEAIERADEGEEVYILQKITEDTTLAELRGALAFAVFAKDETNIKEKLKEAEKEIEKDSPVEEVAEQTEAPADKRKRGRPARIDRAKVKALFDAGWTPEKIAKEVDASVSTIRGIVMAEDL